MDPLKYIFQKAMPTGKLAKFPMLLSKFNIVYVNQKGITAWRLFFDRAANYQDKGIGASSLSVRI